MKLDYQSIKTIPQKIFNRMKKHRLDRQKRILFNCEMEWEQLPPSVLPKNMHFSFRIRVKNTGSETWQPSSESGENSILIGGGFYRGKRLIQYFGGWHELQHPVKPGEEISVEIQTNNEGLSLGFHTLHVECVKTADGFFSEWGAAHLSHIMDVALLDESGQLWNRGLHVCTNMWSPTEGVSKNKHSHYPLFITYTNKARVTDLQGDEYLDYIMGWGTAVLGYNHPDVQEAILRHMHIAPTLSLTHPLQIEVAEKLCEMLPCGERVLFGKNGSDVLQAAVRIARTYRNKDTVLCCGYHGFHDWFMGTVPTVNGIPQAVRDMVEAFPYGDLEYLEERLNRTDDIAAIVMEPLFHHYASTEYLQTIRLWTLERDIPLIFDEIMSAFRIANGGAQEKYGVIPDMVTVGKGIANGMPLAALAGSRKYMDMSFHIGYGPTFQGEVYSLAAASAALDVFQREPVCETVFGLSSSLQQMFIEQAKQFDIPVELQGFPTRQMIFFHPYKQYSTAQLRTYFLQELLHHHILTAGHWLTSYAHTAEDIEFTAATVGKILSKMKHYLDHDELEHHIHVPMHQLFVGEKITNT